MLGEQWGRVFDKNNKQLSRLLKEYILFYFKESKEEFHRQTL